MGIINDTKRVYNSEDISRLDMATGIYEMFNGIFIDLNSIIAVTSPGISMHSHDYGEYAIKVRLSSKYIHICDKDHSFFGEHFGNVHERMDREKELALSEIKRLHAEFIEVWKAFKTGLVKVEHGNKIIPLVKNDEFESSLSITPEGSVSIIQSTREHGPDDDPEDEDLESTEELLLVDKGVILI